MLRVPRSSRLKFGDTGFWHKSLHAMLAYGHGTGLVTLARRTPIDSCQGEFQLKAWSGVSAIDRATPP